MRATAAVLGLVVGASSWTSTLEAQTTVRLSSAGSGAAANDASVDPAISDDGRIVAFVSAASDLVALDSNGTADVFAHDRQTLALTRVSVGAGGQANGASSAPSLSADGGLVAFVSDADNLAANDTNAAGDVFLHDRASGVTLLVSVATNGSAANGASGQPSLSGNGRFVAFQSYATNLLAVDGNSVADVFVRDLQTGVTTRVSLDSGGYPLDHHSGAPAISANGMQVAFESLSGAIVVGDLNHCSDVFVFNRTTSMSTRVSVNPHGAVTHKPSNAPSISADGRYVAFHSMAPNITQNDANGNIVDAFVRDMQTGTSTLVSLSDSGVQGTSACRVADVSNDGRYVVFETPSPELVAGDTNAAKDVCLRDVTAGTTRRISVESHGMQADGSSGLAAISGDGRWIAFESTAANLAPGDTNGASDVFLHDRAGIPVGSEVYCTPSTSTLGCVSTIAAAGVASLSATSGFTLACSGMEGQRAGLFFYGASGAAAHPWGAGSTSFLCVQPPTQRTSVLTSGGTPAQCNGSLALDLLAFWAANPTALGQPLALGERFEAQAWFRDPLAPKSTNLSNAVRFWIAP